MVTVVVGFKFQTTDDGHDHRRTGPAVRLQPFEVPLKSPRRGLLGSLALPSIVVITDGGLALATGVDADARAQVLWVNVQNNRKGNV